MKSKRSRSINWLTTLDLENFIRKYANKKTVTAFLGVFSIDQLPPEKLPFARLPVLFIVNTNPSNLPGQHWKAVFIGKNRNGEIFDSLAAPISLKLQQWMTRNTHRWITSKLTLQNPLSASCGGYVLYYVMTRLHYNSLKACVKPFSRNIYDNDEIMQLFYNSVSRRKK